MVLEYLQIQSNVYASLCFSASPPRIGYRSLWMHEGLSPPWFTTPRGISATCNMKSRSDQTPHPLWVVIKCSAPGKTKFIKFPPSRAGKYVKCPGYARGEGRMFKLRFDWYITTKQTQTAWVKMIIEKKEKSFFSNDKKNQQSLIRILKTCDDVVQESTFYTVLWIFRTWKFRTALF